MGIRILTGKRGSAHTDMLFSLIFREYIATLQPCHVRMMVKIRPKNGVNRFLRNLRTLSGAY
jgi:hypothetical protein